ncbi:MAG: molybdopterin-dependent oxidoreductase, partial [Terriglobia bacterium]
TGVANTWGYGAMTNSFTDIRNAKTQIIMGGNPAEAHPVSMQHLLEGAEMRKANVVVIDPRLTRTAAHATEYVRIRPGTDIPVLYGMLWHVLKNGWEDKEFIRQRVYGFEDLRKEAEKWNPEECERVSGVPGAQMERIAKMFATQKPATIIWCMGQTQHSIGNAMVRASCIVQLALGNIGVSGGGANIFRGHDNVQGATDLGPNPDSLPAYYGLAPGAWKHWAAVWGVDYEWIQKQFAPGMMEKSGMTVSRWIDGVLEKNENIDQPSNLRAVVYWGHAPNSQTRGKEMVDAMKQLDTMVIIDPYPSATAAMAAMVRKDGVYLLPACTQYETSGSVTASNRALQWRERVIEPLFESKPDHTLMAAFAKKFG